MRRKALLLSKKRHKPISPEERQILVSRYLPSVAIASINIPVVTPADFELSAGYGLDDLIGHITASNTPTSYAITSGNPSGYFAIYSSGNLRTSASVLPPAGIYSLQITATNANGTSDPATIGVTLQGAVISKQPASANRILSRVAPTVDIALLGVKQPARANRFITTTAPIVAHSAVFPDATTTGVPTGESLTNSGSISMDTPGATVTNLNISGTVSIGASNVTLKNCRITNSHGNSGIGIGNVSGVTIQDCEINGGGSSSYGILSRSGGTGNKYLRCNIYGSENGIDPGNGDEIRDCYIHGILNTDNADPHYDGIEFDGGNGLLIEHTTVDMSELDTNSAIMLDNYFSGLSNVTVNNCLLRGANYTMWMDGRFSGGSVSNINITNNHIEAGQSNPSHYYLYQGTYAPVHTGNVDWITLASID